MTLIEDIEAKKKEFLSQKENNNSLFVQVFGELEQTFFYFQGKDGVSTERIQNEDHVVLKASKNNFYLQLRCYEKSHYFTISNPNMGEMAYQLDRVGHLYEMIAIAFAQLLIGESDEVSKSKSLPSRPG